MKMHHSGENVSMFKGPGGNEKWEMDKTVLAQTRSQTRVRSVKHRAALPLTSQDWQILGILTLVGLVVRIFRVYQPTSVVFDEVHFGGFASKYIKGKFFMDVHPPLAKLLITLFGWLAGFTGNFDFKSIGKEYSEASGVPYVAMRLFPALCGVLTIITIYLTLRANSCRISTATLAAVLLTFENGLITQSRFILLDSPLLLCTALTILFWTCFTVLHDQGPAVSFTTSWWMWLSLTGLGLGATVSVKWVGLFTIAWVGILTILQLWHLLGDVNNVTPRLWCKHFSARFLCLLMIPLAFYTLMFKVHFKCLVNPGDGDGFMSSEFQSTLNSKQIQDSPADVIFGSRVTIRHFNSQGGYLHSHNHMYPTGSKQQQITLYPHKDENNVWIVENSSQPVDEKNNTISGPLAWDNLETPNYVYDGSVIRLYHTTTHRRLHSHDHRPPVSDVDWLKEVSAYGFEGFPGDANDLFRVSIIPQMSSPSNNGTARKRLRTIQSKFKLTHVLSGCVLFSRRVKLPPWGFEQQEVSCAIGSTLPNSVWYIESNSHPLLSSDPNIEKVNYLRPNFLQKFLELQRVMWTTNAGLVESHAWDSRPYIWPILKRGINFWSKNHRQIYLIGNPFTWWLSSSSVLAYTIFKIIAILRWQRGYLDYISPAFSQFDHEVGISVLGWALHYFPFFLMRRQLFLHHYFPALYFSLLTFCLLFDYITSRFSIFRINRFPFISRAIVVLLMSSAIFTYTIYAPLAYGNAWTKSQCKAAKLFDTWDWDCNIFPESYDSYKTSFLSNPSLPSAPSTPVKVNPSLRNEQVDSLLPPPVAAAVKRKSSGVLVKSERRVEYRDQHGNLLNEEQVKALSGKVSFETRSEVRTRLIDKHGNLLPGQ